MTRSTSSIGQIGEVAIMHRLMKHGWQVLIPYGNSAPYDLVAEQNGKIVRLQVRTTFAKSSSIRVNCRTKNNRVRINLESFDFLILYEFNSEIAFVIPRAEIMGKAAFFLRLSPSQSGQIKGTHSAIEYQERWDKLYMV